MYDTPDPYRSPNEPPPLRPPVPEPYRIPDWNPSNPPPMEPPGTPNPVDPRNNPWGFVWSLGLVAAMILILPGLAHAAGAGGGAMPWDAPLTTLRTDLTGTAATGVALIAAFGVLAVLCFGGELTHFARTMCFVVFAISSLVLLNNLLTSLGIAGASVDGGGDIWWLMAMSLGAGLMAIGATLFGFHVNRILRRWRARRDVDEAAL